MRLKRLYSIVAGTGALPVGFFEQWEQGESARSNQSGSRLKQINRKTLIKHPSGPSAFSVAGNKTPWS
jgi:hypothetical protein